ncbi:hypothetical protein [uncultured Ornithinimicrobium sp.]|uniref:hypothetical protein n=1 Tax=uncultured Ornithinimicrobium sp. TaxID=259307 RepID=UPI00259AC59D|nr:hypothetical protein [uncultured Ornithinimicrobium sp.]
MSQALARRRLIESAQRRWRAVNAPHLVRAGATFEKGKFDEDIVSTGHIPDDRGMGHRIGVSMQLP